MKNTLNWGNLRTTYGLIVSILLAAIVCWLVINRLNFSNDQSPPISSQLNEKYPESSDITFLNKVVDFGIVSQDTFLTAIFCFKNVGTNVLHIYSVKPDCICTGFDISKNDIIPGDSSNITLMFNTEGRYGKQKLYAIVHTNTKSKFHKLTLKANIDNLPQ